MEKSIVVGQKERVGAWVAERINRTAPWGAFEAIGLESEGKLIAGAVYEGYVKDARCTVHLAGDGKSWLNREYLWLNFNYVFNQLNCKVLIGLVDADNPDALRFDKHIGFEEVARIPDGAGDCDLVVLAMQRKKCRWLNMKRGK